MGNAVPAARAIPYNAHRPLDLHQPGRHDDRRLRAHAPDRLTATARRRRHPPALRDLRARRHRVRRRGQLRRTRRATPQRAAAAGTATRRTTSSCRGARSRARASRRWRATRGAATTLAIAVGCFNGPQPPCSVAAGGGICHLLYGADVTINDPTAPAAVGRGLRPAGRRRARGLGPDHASPPATTPASAASSCSTSQPGGAARRRRRGLRDRPRTDARRDCSYSLPAPCPDLTRETVRATALPAGQRALLGPRRPTPAATSSTAARTRCLAARRPTAARSTAPAPPNRHAVGELDGHEGKRGARSATAPAAAVARPADQQLRRSRSPARSCACSRATCAPARARPARDDARPTPTAASASRSRASASRLLQFAWLSHANDPPSPPTAT